MSDEISTSELTAAEIVYARASDALRVDADGFGFVKRDWLTKFREAVRERGMVNRVTNAIAEYDRTHPESLSYSTMAGIAIEVIGEQLARDLIAAQAEVAAWRSAYGSATGLGPQSPDEVAAFVREDDRVEREHSSHLNKQLIAAQQRIAELEDGQRADSGAECREFRYADRVAGIDKHGCYQVASDGTRCDADPVCVLKVAESQVRVLTARIAELERNRDEGMTMLQVRGEHLAAAEARIAELERHLVDSIADCAAMAAVPDWNELTASLLRTTRAQLVAAEARIAELEAESSRTADLYRDRKAHWHKQMESLESKLAAAEAAIARVEAVIASMQIHQAYHWASLLAEALTPPSEVQDG